MKKKSAGKGCDSRLLFEGLAISKDDSFEMPLLLIELKWNKIDKGTIRQIKSNDYPQALRGYGGDILMVGINYDAKSKKHTCKIETCQK